jgi:glycosyltransferase involved in cell wall biosynthesis
MQKTILHRIYNLHSGGAEVVMLNIVKSFPEYNHKIAFDNFQDTWVSKELEHLSNVIFFKSNIFEFPNQSCSIDPDLIIFHFYDPMNEADFEELPHYLRRRSVIYNHFFVPVPAINDVYKYIFVSSDSFNRTGLYVKHLPSSIIINPVSDIFFEKVDVSKPKSSYLIGRHSQPWHLKFPENFVSMVESIQCANLVVKILGASMEVRDEILTTPRRHQYELFEFNSKIPALFLRELDIYIYGTNSSIVESGPLVILEAMASGVPIVAENRGAMRDFIIHGETGFLYSNENEFKEFVEAILLDRMLAEKLASAAKNWAESNCSLENYRNNLKMACNLGTSINSSTFPA